jgi:hypothetical protein
LIWIMFHFFVFDLVDCCSPLFVATRLGYDAVHWMARSGTCCVFIARIHCCYSILFLNPSLSVLSILTISIRPSICMCWSMWS